MTNSMPQAREAWGWVKKREWNLLSCVRLFATPWTIQSMKFSRLEYRSGWSEVNSLSLSVTLADSLSPTLCDPMDCSLSGSSIHGLFQARVLEWIAISFSRGIFPTQGSNLGLPHCRQTLYCLSHQGSRLSFLQGIFPTQGLNPDLPRCRQILYQLRHKENPWGWVGGHKTKEIKDTLKRTQFSCPLAFLTSPHHTQTQSLSLSCTCWIPSMNSDFTYLSFLTPKETTIWML